MRSRRAVEKSSEHGGQEEQVQGGGVRLQQGLLGVYCNTKTLVLDRMRDGVEEVEDGFPLQKPPKILFSAQKDTSKRGMLRAHCRVS
mmetsp:Transcript_22901/g.38757  ORF Transcript_22901/g.38757 Transcript_22901/m.38757 type:complete len:87 (-) Transcript_22901:290-550(-)